MNENEIFATSRELVETRRPRGMTAISVTLAAGTPQRFNIAGDYFHVLDAPSADLVVRFNDAKTMPGRAGVGCRVYYEVIELSSAGGQSVTVLVGFGSVSDGRGTLTNEGAASNDTPATARVTVAAGTQQLLIAADGSRQAVRVTNPSNSNGDVYIGDADVAAALHGGLLEVGITDYIATTAALYAYNPGASDVDIYVLPLRRA